MNRNELVIELSQFLESMKTKPIEKDTMDWYVYNNLLKLFNVVKEENNAAELWLAGEKFNYFCVDSASTDMVVFNKIIKFGNNAVRIAKAEGYVAK